MLNFSTGEALKKEMDYFAEHTDSARDEFLSLKSAGDVKRHVEDRYEYKDVIALARSLKPCALLDIGVAYGVTSAYFALQGHSVTAVEPSLELCRDMQNHFARLGITMKIVNGTGESLHQLESAFDAAVFYSSLHHCDDPVLALKNVHGRLKPGGTVVLFEPVLKFYRSKKWFYETLEKNPEKLGHYGGNEHIYRVSEYVEFLKEAGFARIAIEPSVAYGLVPKRAPWDSDARYRIKKMYFAFVRAVVLNGFFGRLLQPLLFRLSLLNPVIKATR
jgi:SAM-dependent methyltransferase